MEFEAWRMEPGYIFRRMQQVAVAAFTAECGGLDLTCLQYAALARIRERPGIDATRLAELLDLDRSTMGGVIERLELKRYVERASTTGDRRIKVLTASRAGVAVLGRIKPCFARINDRVLKCLSVEERTILLGLMSRLVDANADTATPTNPAPEPRTVTVKQAPARSSASLTARTLGRTTARTARLAKPA